MSLDSLQQHSSTLGAPPPKKGGGSEKSESEQSEFQKLKRIEKGSKSGPNNKHSLERGGVRKVVKTMGGKKSALESKWKAENVPTSTVMDKKNMPQKAKRVSAPALASGLAPGFTFATLSQEKSTIMFSAET